jgi:sugar phosphate isomerase/epimerase
VADNLPLDRLSEDELDEFGSRARQGGIQVETGTRGIAPPHLQRYLSLAVRLGSPILRVVIDTPDYHPTPEEAVELLAPLKREFEQHGVVLAIENHDRFPVRVLAGMVRQLGDWAGICLDTVNSFGALEGPQSVVEALAPLTVNLHVKDFTIFRASHSMGFTIEGRPAGQGRLNLPWLLDVLRGYGRDPNAILELWTPPEDTLEGTIAREQRWAEESVAYLRTLIPT